MSPRADTIELSRAELRDVASFAAACARTVLTLFEDEHSHDLRSPEALEAFAAGGKRGTVPHQEFARR